MAMTFNGTNQYCNIANNTSLNITGALTISAWFKVTSAPAQFLYVFAKPFDGQTGLYGMSSYNTANTLQATIRWGTPTTSFTSATVTNASMFNGSWHHGCMVFNTATLVIYCDSVAGTAVASGGASIIAGTFHTTVGAYDPLTEAGAGLGLYWPGSIDDVRLYNRALPASEVQTIYATNGCDSIYQGIVSKWALNESGIGTAATGTGTVKDSCGNHNDLSPTNSPTYAGSNLKRRKYLK